MDLNELTNKFGDYVAVSVIPGPNDKPSKTVDDKNKDLKENKKNCCQSRGLQEWIIRKYWTFKRFISGIKY